MERAAMFLAAFTNSEGKVFNLILSQSLALNERALWFLSSFSRSRAPRNSSRVRSSIHKREYVMNINPIAYLSRYFEQGYWLQLLCNKYKNYVSTICKKGLTFVEMPSVKETLFLLIILNKYLALLILSELYVLMFKLALSNVHVGIKKTLHELEQLIDSKIQVELNIHLDDFEFFKIQIIPRKSSFFTQSTVNFVCISPIQNCDITYLSETWTGFNNSD
jgi:hypothetical protein